MHFLARLLINAAALWVATNVVPGITYQGRWTSLFIVALVFGVLNASVRPLIKVLTFPLLILTLGLFTFVINALMLMLTGWFSDRFDLGLHVAGFWPAFWAAWS
jgi:putative membrane protein